MGNEDGSLKQKMDCFSNAADVSRCDLMEQDSHEESLTLSESAQIVDIRVADIVAHRHTDAAVSDDIGASDEAAERVSVDFNFNSSSNESKEILTVSVQTTFGNLPQGSLSVTVEALLHIPGLTRDAPSNEQIHDYMNRDGFRMIEPFIRQEVLDSSRRVLNGQIVLPLMPIRAD
ncbi:MAG: hypothetical protein ACTH1Z_11740 [Ancrocorticia sp.]|uniref:hypothetical protein n=1 Tax=Ancrocorticia sp. TaxID=2593684 RepID=UPI003F937689